MKWIITVIACAGLVGFAGCNSGESQPGGTPETNSLSSQATMPDAPVETSTAPETASTPTPAPSQN